MTTDAFIILPSQWYEDGVRDGRASALEEAAKLAEPKRKPCDCVKKIADGTWFCDCGCSNSGDFANAMAWCSDANIAAAIRALNNK